MDALGATGFSAILLTHEHRDHVQGIPEVFRVFGRCPVLKYVVGSAQEDSIKDQCQIEFTPVADGEVLRFEGVTLTAMHTPGHEIDHLGFYMEEEAALFTGDIVQGRGSVRTRQTLLNNYKDYLKSIARMQAQHPSVVYPAHGPVCGPERIDESLLHRRQRELQVIEALKSGPKTLEELVKLVYAEVTDPRLVPFASKG
jgi:glyoxylase-like metal-dependent hydrolase (beta-lactamase superfamily II)